MSNIKFEHRTGKLFLALKNNKQWFKNVFRDELIYEVYKFTNEWRKFTIKRNSWLQMSKTSKKFLTTFEFGNFQIHLYYKRNDLEDFSLPVYATHDGSVYAVGFVLTVESPTIRAIAQQEYGPTSRSCVTAKGLSWSNRKIDHLSRLPMCQETDFESLVFFAKVSMNKVVLKSDIMRIPLTFTYFWTIPEFRDSETSSPICINGIDCINFEYTMDYEFDSLRLNLWYYRQIGQIFFLKADIVIFNANTGETYDTPLETGKGLRRFHTRELPAPSEYPVTLSIFVKIIAIRVQHVPQWIPITDENCHKFNIEAKHQTFHSLPHFH